MRRNPAIVISLIIVLLACSINSNAIEWRQKRLSRKELQLEVDRLRYMVDSLMLIVSDSTEEEEIQTDSLNPGELGSMNSEFFENPNPGENIDSLLAQWYSRRKTLTSDMLEADSVIYPSSIPDSVYIRKIKKLNSYIPIPYNEIVRNHIILYTERMPAFSAKVLALGEYYLPIFEEIFDKYGLPKELKAMAIIESGFNPVARSRARAMGMWQFMYSTGRMYGLTMNSYVDERLDPIKACDAAARYLRDSYIVFGDWALAISSYNCGAGNVLKAIRRCGGSTHFWDLYRYLPRETRGYVPAFVGALYLLKYYKDYNITPGAPYSLPPQVDTFEIKKNLHFGQISEVVGVPMETLRLLNPQYIKDIIPGNEKTYILTIPHQYTATFVDHEKDICAYKDSIYFNPIVYASMQDNRAMSEGRSIVHKVKKGETLSRIARRYGVTTSQIMSWNHVKSSRKLRIGQRLHIYRSGGGLEKSSNASAGSAKVTSSSSTQSANSNEPIYYTVKKGDTLSKIARRNNTTLNKLLKLNNLTVKSKIIPGKKLRIK